MRLGLFGIASAAVLLLSSSAASAAEPDDSTLPPPPQPAPTTSGTAAAKKPRKVVVAGPTDDVIAARVQKELTALGFETIRVGALDNCARSAVVVSATDNGAVAATCSDGDQVGVWVTDGTTLRLKDVVVAREEGDRARETTALRAAEVTRATIAQRESEEDAAAQRAAQAAAAKPYQMSPPNSWETFYDKPPVKAPTKVVHRRTPRFAASAGVSSLLGIDASVAAFSGQVEVGVLKEIAFAARLEYPLENQRLGRSNSNVSVAPAFAGLGVDFPILHSGSFIIPRFGAGGGLAWIRAVQPARQAFDSFGQLFTTQNEGVDTVASFALYASAGLSMRIAGPVRILVDGVFGSTTARLVVRDRGNRVAYWGAPFGDLALRLEVMFQ